MLTIRLQRTGKKNQADFRIVLAEKEAPVNKKFIEILGSYNPRKKIFKANPERLNYWISQRVSLSETLHNLLITQKFMEGTKVKAFTIPKKPSSAEATEGKPVEPAAEKPAAEKPAAEKPAAEKPAEATAAPADLSAEASAKAETTAAVETQAEAKEAEAEVEAKVENPPAA